MKQTPNTHITNADLIQRPQHYTRPNDAINTTQEDKIAKLVAPDDEKEFVAQRVLAKYVGVNVRLFICAPLQLIAPGNNPTTGSEYK